MKVTRRRVLVVAGIIVVLCPVCFPWHTTGRHRAGYSWSGIQALGNESELWVFYERCFSIQLRNTPPVTLGKYQEVLVLIEGGLSKRIWIPQEEGPSFHIYGGSWIFALEDGMYLYRGPSRRQHESVFRWREDLFVPLPPDESRKLTQAYGLDALVAAGGYSALDRLSEKNGWRRVFDGLYYLQGRYRWNRLTLSVDWMTTDDELLLKISSDAPGWKDVEISYDREYREVSWSEFKELRFPPRKREQPEP